MGARQLLLELVFKLVQLPGQVLSIPLHFGDSTTMKKLNPFELNKCFIQFRGSTVQEMG
jgi:hypothetical protein